MAFCGWHSNGSAGPCLAEPFYASKSRQALDSLEKLLKISVPKEAFRIELTTLQQDGEGNAKVLLHGAPLDLPTLPDINATTQQPSENESGAGRDSWDTVGLPY